MKKTYLVVIPTKNEAKNIPTIIDEIFRDYSFDILIVDDRSKDGTREYIKRHAQLNSRLFLLERNNHSGLGSAYMEGFKWAIEKEYDYVFQMDGDGFHMPSQLKKLISDEENCMIIASRWIEGSSINHKWSIFRKFLSWSLNRIVKIVFSLPIFDSSSGFRLIDVSLLRKLDTSQFICNGYSFQQELIITAHQSNANISERSADFGYRVYGSSKVDLKVSLELIYDLFKLFLKKNPNNKN